MTDAVLAQYLTPDQATLLHYQRALPPLLRFELGMRLRSELEALRTLVPEPLARDTAGFTRRSGSFWDGTLLCADLSGFTALTEELAAHGLLGLEELSAAINSVFGALLEELHAYGGSVLKFGGDALTGFFDAEEAGPAHSTLACAAALAMQRRMARFAALSTGERTHRLQLRVGVHRGRPFGAIVGDPERYEVVVTGRAVNRVALLQERAAPGEVMISAETLASLPKARSRPRANEHVLLGLPPVRPAPAPPLPPLPPGDDLPTLRTLAGRIAALRPFLPGPLPRHVLSPAARASGEFRPVSALFIGVASLSGVLTLLEELERPAAELINAYYTNTQRVIRRYGGEVNKFDINSVGDKLLAIFGAPVAHEDDPERAVAAALDLAPALEQANQQLRELLDAELRAGEGRGGAGASLWRTVDLSLRQRVGVATGNVFAGLVGSPRRREYTVIGQVVNLAARLMSTAEPGSVTVAPATARAAGGSFTFEPLPPLTLKGFAQPVAASVALRRAAPHAAPPRPITPLVDRTHELALLRALAPVALRGAGRVVAVSGEPGIGKSRLIGAFWEELDDGHTRLIALNGRAYAQHTPYSVVRDLLAELLALPADADPELLGEAVSAAVAECAPEFAALAPLLDAVFAVELSAGADSGAAGRGRAQPALARLPEAQQRERLHDLIVALFVGAVERQPTALLIDDLHWADASSLEIVGRLAQVADRLPLLLVLSHRANTLRAAPWLDLPHTSVIQLEGLDRDSSLVLLDHLLDGLPAGAFEPVLERAQGSPFFLEALVRHLVDRGVVQRDDGGAWRLVEPLSDRSVPETIEPVLAAQLDQLDEATRELLQVAAVIGTRIPYRILAGVYSQARQPARHLLELVESGILVTDDQSSQPTFHFRQALLHDVAYQSILYAQRRELHRRVAEQIETVFGPQIERFDAELAHHYAQAEEHVLACRYALRAARSSRQRHALPEALAAYNQARVIAEQHPGALDRDEALGALEELADVEVLAGHYAQAREHYDALLAETSRGGDSDSGLRTVMLSRKVGGIYEQQSRFDEALEWLDRARRSLETSSRPLAGALAELQTAREVDPGAWQLELSRIYSTTGWVYFRRGEPERARHLLDEGLRVLDEIENHVDEVLEERARVYNRLGGVAWMLGNLRAARVYVERSLADFSARNNLLGKADAQNNLGILAEQLGDWQGAISSYRAALEANQQSGRRRAAAMSRLNLGAAHLQLGEAAAAVPLLEQATAETRELRDTIHEIMALRWLGRAYTRLGQFDEAQQVLSRALAAARGAQLLLDQLDTYTALGELALARADLDAARAAYSGGDVLLGRVDRTTLEAGLFLRFAAEVEERSGAPGRATALRAESGMIFRDLGLGSGPGAP